MPRKKRKRAYIAFRYEERTLKHYLKGQLRNRSVGVTVSDYSMKEATPDSKWKKRAEERIKRANQVVVLVGPTTHNARGVKEEVKIARRLGKPVCQIRAVKGKQCPRVPGAGRYYRWTHANLEKIFGTTKKH